MHDTIPNFLFSLCDLLSKQIGRVFRKEMIKRSRTLNSVSAFLFLYPESDLKITYNNTVASFLYERQEKDNVLLLFVFLIPRHLHAYQLFFAINIYQNGVWKSMSHFLYLKDGQILQYHIIFIVSCHLQ